MILLVEDNEDDIFFFQRVLRKVRIRNPLHIARDGQQAVDYLSGSGEFADRARYPLPFLIFLDLKMPYLNGFEVLGWIRTRPELNPISVVVLTSSPEERDYQRAYSLGARSYLVKPPTPEMLLNLVKSMENDFNALGRPDPFVIETGTAAQMQA